MPNGRRGEIDAKGKKNVHRIKTTVGLTLALCAMGITAPSTGRDNAAISPGARFVAMGSSFASGSGIAPYDPAAPARCQRSQENYAHQLAREQGLTLVDVTCGGATTANILGPWNELAPQVDALTPDTALVTLTIGGNDVGYIGGLIAGSCTDSPSPGAVAQPFCQMIAADRRSGAAMPAATEEAWLKLEKALIGIVQEIRRRSPHARIIFVDYLTVLPEGKLCAQTPLSPQAAEIGHATAKRLAQLTARAARSNGAEVLAASELSRGEHSACGRTAWMNGFNPIAGDRSFVPYHPNQAGMTAIADALARQLRD